jgi:thiamine-monophosphate kinase
MAGEFEFLSWIGRRQRASELTRVGVGDDLAVLKWPSGNLLLVGVDQVLDQVHFDSTIHAPRFIGRKAMNRNLSDCAAMGCLPAAAVATVALPAGCGLEYAQELYLGMEEAAGAFDCAIVGGDTGTWGGKLAMTVTILGRSGGVEPITRGGAKPGDFVFVSGPLGGSILGRHMTFEPRVTLGRKLAEEHFPSAMIDLSDGLSRDLAHICRQSGVGAIVEADAVPIHPDATKLAKDGRATILHALNDGEDYELLLTSAGAGHPGLIRIGQITADAAILLRTPGSSPGQAATMSPLEPLAWEHRL